MFESAFDNYTLYNRNDDRPLFHKNDKERHIAQFMLVDDTPTLLLCDMSNLYGERLHVVRLKMIDLTKVTNVATNDGTTKINGKSYFSKSLTFRRPNRIGNAEIPNLQDIKNKEPDATSIAIIQEQYTESIYETTTAALHQIRHQQQLDRPNYMSKSVLIPNFKLANTLITNAQMRLYRENNKIILKPKRLSNCAVILIATAVCIMLMTVYTMKNYPIPITIALLVIGLILIILTTLIPTLTIQAEHEALDYATRQAYVPIRPNATIIREENKRYLLFSQTEDKTKQLIKDTLVIISGEDEIPSQSFEPIKHTITFSGNGIWSCTSNRHDVWEEIIPSRDIPHMTREENFTIADIFSPSLTEITKRAAKL